MGACNPPGPEILDAIFKDIREGKPLKESIDKYWTWSDFFKYMYLNPTVENAYLHAQRVRAELYVEQQVEIADNELDPNRARVRIDARRWYASKMHASKYGDRVDINVTQTVDIGAALQDARRRVASITHPDNISDAEIVETKQITNDQHSDSESLVDDTGDIFK